MISLLSQQVSPQHVTLSNGVELAFNINHGRLLGLSQVTVDGIRLIAPDSTRLPVLETRNGWQVSEYHVTDMHQDTAGFTLTCKVMGSKTGIGHKSDVLNFAYITSPRHTPQPLGIFRWHFIPRTFTLGHKAIRQQTYQGLSYHFEFELEHDFHWILDSGTWEVGGDPQDVRMLSQRMHPPAGPLDFTVSRQGRSFSSSESFIPKTSNNATTVPDIPNDPTMGFILPIQAQLRGAGGALIDMQYKDQQILMGFYEQADYYRTLIEWRTDDPGIGHMDHHYFPLTQSHTTPAKTILATQDSQLTHNKAINLWTDALDHVATLWQKQVDIPAQQPISGMGIDCCGSAGKHLGSGPHDLFDRWEERFEWMQQTGLEYLSFGGIGNHRGNDQPYIGNMCQPYDYTITETFGGPERFKKFCQCAHQHNIKIVLWIGGHLSDWAPMLKENPQWTIQYDNGTPWDGSYRIMRSCNYGKGYGDWMFEQMKHLKELGLDMLFFDSYHNLAALPIDYSDPALPPQLQNLWQFQAKCQQIGLPMLIETVGPIGMTSCGLWPEYLQAPELCYRTHFRCKVYDDREPSDLLSGLINPSIYFRMLANQSPIGFSVLEQANAPFQGLPDIPQPYVTMLQTYRQLKDLMQIRTIQEDGSIAWMTLGAHEGCLFAVDTGSITVPDGYQAQPVYNSQTTYQPGCHPIKGNAAFKLIGQ